MSSSNILTRSPLFAFVLSLPPPSSQNIFSSYRVHLSICCPSVFPPCRAGKTLRGCGTRLGLCSNRAYPASITEPLFPQHLLWGAWVHSLLLAINFLWSQSGGRRGRMSLGRLMLSVQWFGVCSSSSPVNRIAALTLSIRGAWAGSAQQEKSKAEVLDRGCLSRWDEAAASPGAVKQKGLGTTPEWLESF